LEAGDRQTNNSRYDLERKIQTMENRNYINRNDKKIRHIGLVSALAVLMLLVLAACGTSGATDQPAAVVADPTPTETAPEAVATNGPNMASGTTTEVPEAVATEMDDMGGMMDAMDSTPTAVEPQTEASDAATPTEAAGSEGSDDTGTGGSTGGVVKVQGTLREWAIDLSRQEVATGTVRFVVTNEGQFAHNFAITDASGTIAKTTTFGARDGAQTLEVELQPGTYTIVCDLPGHAARGQQIELTVK
jgi:hypothetical protein